MQRIEYLSQSRSSSRSSPNQNLTHTAPAIYMKCTRERFLLKTQRTVGVINSHYNFSKLWKRSDKGRKIRQRLIFYGSNRSSTKSLSSVYIVPNVMENGRFSIQYHWTFNGNPCQENWECRWKKLAYIVRNVMENGRFYMQYHWTLNGKPVKRPESVVGENRIDINRAMQPTTVILLLSKDAIIQTW